MSDPLVDLRDQRRQSGRCWWRGHCWSRWYRIEVKKAYYDVLVRVQSRECLRCGKTSQVEL